MEAIRADLQPYLALAYPPLNNAPVIGRATVSGMPLRYHAYAVSEGVVNVEAITGP